MMINIERQKYLQYITRRLIIFTGIVLLCITFLVYILYWFMPNGSHSYLVLLVFVTGLLGGFVSIQQRLPSIAVDELKILSGSWFSITLIPINGGIFAMVIMLVFIGNILQGALFPQYPQFDIESISDFKNWILSAYPETGSDVAKLLFWSFVAGFSERFVPQIIRKSANEVISEESPGSDIQKKKSNRPDSED